MRPRWFKHEPEKTATGYRWLDLLLDLLTGPYWRIMDHIWQRRFWRVLRVGDETWRQARDRMRRHFREHPEHLEDR